MNIFERLKDHYAGPQHEFEAVAAEIITFMEGATRVKPYPGDDGMDLYSSDQEGNKDTIWQIKYHPDQWTPNQKDKITADIKKAEDHKPKNWVLVIPKDPTPKDIEWWEAEKKKHPFKMELLTGGKLELLLARSSGIRGQAIQKKILGTAIKSAEVSAHWVKSKIPIESNWTLCVHIKNTGNSSLEEVKVQLHHSKTGMVVSGPAQPTWMQKTNSLNPWHLALKETLHPTDDIVIKKIEFRKEPPKEDFFCRGKVTAKDMDALTFDLEKPTRVETLQLSKDAEDFIKTWKPTARFVHIIRGCSAFGLGNVGFYETETDHNYCKGVPVYEAEGVEEILEELAASSLLKSRGIAPGPDGGRELFKISDSLQQMLAENQPEK